MKSRNIVAFESNHESLYWLYWYMQWDIYTIVQVFFHCFLAVFIKLCDNTQRITLVFNWNIKSYCYAQLNSILFFLYMRQIIINWNEIVWFLYIYILWWCMCLYKFMSYFSYIPYFYCFWSSVSVFALHICSKKKIQDTCP